MGSKIKKVEVIDGRFRMAGTEGTFNYKVLVVTDRGRLGIRDLGNRVRIRVEPIDSDAADKMADNFPTDNWKQYGQEGQLRFSTVVGMDGLKDAVLAACTGLGVEPKAAKKFLGRGDLSKKKPMIVTKLALPPAPAQNADTSEAIEAF